MLDLIQGKVETANTIEEWLATINFINHKIYLVLRTRPFKVSMYDLYVVPCPKDLSSFETFKK
jgi:hypothetical protein